jgi:hypothetical protein
MENKRTFDVRLFLFCAALFSAPHQGCKPPTPADVFLKTPRAGGRVMGKNGLARRAAERLTFNLGIGETDR